ncbi:MAG: hypothetical protein EP298_01755 [Gammaproteobacteria bacterium]|nr:MAG: hypothetical protein EP298_01755 [Gammaproteobacteria bacterium]UTW41365.1 hypothetical protein KFE69_07525 [bacterium SCSIO 12844]
MLSAKQFTNTVRKEVQSRGIHTVPRLLQVLRNENIENKNAFMDRLHMVLKLHNSLNEAHVSYIEKHNNSKDESDKDYIKLSVAQLASMTTASEHMQEHDFEKAILEAELSENDKEIYNQHITDQYIRLCSRQLYILPQNKKKSQHYAVSSACERVKELLSPPSDKNDGWSKLAEYLVRELSGGKEAFKRAVQTYTNEMTDDHHKPYTDITPETSAGKFISHWGVDTKLIIEHVQNYSELTDQAKKEFKVCYPDQQELLDMLFKMGLINEEEYKSLGDYVDNMREVIMYEESAEKTLSINKVIKELNTTIEYYENKTEGDKSKGIMTSSDSDILVGLKDCYELVTNILLRSSKSNSILRQEATEVDHLLKEQIQRIHEFKHDNVEYK